MSQQENPSKTVDLSKRFLQLAYEQLNPDTTTLAGVEQALVNWFCEKYDIPPTDPRVGDMYLEELMVMWQMHRLRTNPELVNEIDSGSGSYEDWLRKEMGEEYVSPEEMQARAEALEAQEKAEIKRLEEKLPEHITTDFSNPNLVK